MNEWSWPDEGELVVCTVTKVKDFVAFVHLDEYEDREGLIPISEIATGWIKYIRDHVSRGPEDRLQGAPRRPESRPHRPL